MAPSQVAIWITISSLCAAWVVVIFLLMVLRSIDLIAQNTCLYSIYSRYKVHARKSLSLIQLKKETHSRYKSTQTKRTLSNKNKKKNYRILYFMVRCITYHTKHVQKYSGTSRIQNKYFSHTRCTYLY